jgi:nicotinamidase-related amidase
MASASAFAAAYERSLPVTEQLTIDPKASALLAMDFQTTIVEGHAANRDELLARSAALLQAARRVGIKVIYVVVGFRPGYPEVSPRNKSFSAVRSSGRFAAGDVNAEIHVAVAPQEGEVIVTKHRVGAFLGTDLDMVLRANGIDTLILTGIATSGVVLSTLRYAADADYGLIVARDCCSDGDEEVHRVLLDKVFPRQATVTTSAEIIAALT